MTARLPSLSDMWDTAVYKRKGTNIQGSNGTDLLSNLFLGHFELKKCSTTRFYIQIKKDGSMISIFFICLDKGKKNASNLNA